jgi:hypothetical protein
MPPKRAIQDEQVLQQLEDHVFNIYGWANKLPDDHPKTDVINCYGPSTKGWEAVARSMEKNGEDPWRSSLALTPRELDPTLEDEGVRRYLIVGYAYRGLNSITRTKPIVQKKQQAVGVTTEGRLVKSSEVSVIVVTEILKARRGGVQLWALICPNNGLCTPYKIAQKDAFYLAAYRDMTTDIKSRGPAWNEKVAVQATRILPTPHTRGHSKPEKDTSKIVLTPERSLRNEILFLFECFKKSREPWLMQELSQVLKEAHSDLEFIPPASHVAQRKFADEDETDFTMADAQAMWSEFDKQWPTADLEGVTPENILTLKQQLVKDELELEYRHLRPFVIEGCYRLNQTPSEATKGWGDIAYDALSAVRRIVGDSEPRLSISAQDSDAMLLVVKEKLKELLAAGNQFDRDMKDSCGSQVVAAETLEDIWEQYSKSADVDSARKAWFAAARYLASALRQKQGGIQAELQRIVDSLEGKERT